MDSLAFDGYTSYSDTSTPRTPSPQDMSAYPPPHHIKHDIDQPIRHLFNDDEHSPTAHIVIPQDNNYWPPSANHGNNFAYSGTNHHHRPDMYHNDDSLSPDYSPETPFHVPQAHWDPHHNGSQKPGEIAVMRRATFPYIRQDREDGMPMQQYPNFMHEQQQSHHHHQQQHQQQQHQMAHHGHQQHQPMNPYPPRQESAYGDAYLPSSSYREYDDHASIKLEESTANMMPPQHQQNFYRPHSNSSAGIAGHPMPNLSYLSPHAGALPVQHTDDAASKETQYLRRRCFNCHTTEPPSWRRSTLNPGKIVCNKCGLYERTHLRPRPLRFDELRAGNKARKGGKASAAAAGSGGASVSPKQSKMNIKRETGLVRRSSVSSSSSVHSSSGASDWDDNVSVYSSGSAPPTSYPSPAANNFPLSRDSQSPPRDGGIRLPTNPLSDIASMHGQNPQSSTTPLLPSTVAPRKSHSSPTYYSPSLSASTMPPVAENAVWSAEPEDVSAVPSSAANGNGLLPASS
ncbi:hypothetical protein CPB83DRAFT_755121 [Crepidotus variabilis]|uniref:GATA-type domain-containing protein n=1 Tax=Crepidotus variabilis TaxID=179855 RepID=A0A9P6ER74_9AGAR|nr:hypothetical protein CPB83DRAFT_755121 [Crepidotus variabilis]